MASFNLGQLLPLPLFLTAVTPQVAQARAWPPFISEMMLYLPTWAYEHRVPGFARNCCGGMFWSWPPSVPVTC